MNDVPSISIPKPRKTEETIVGIQPTSRPPQSSHDAEERPTPVMDGVPDSFTAITQKCLALGKEKQALSEDVRKLTEELERSRETNRQSAQALAELETRVSSAERERARAEAAHAQAENDFERERAAHSETKNDLECARETAKKLERMLGEVIKGSGDEALEYYRNRVDIQAGRIRELERALDQQTDPEVRAEAIHTMKMAMRQLEETATDLAIRIRRMGGDPFDFEGMETDEDERDRVSSELRARAADSALPVPSFPPVPSIPRAPLVPTGTHAMMTRSPRPDETAETKADDDADVPQRNTNMGFPAFTAPSSGTRH